MIKVVLAQRGGQIVDFGQRFFGTGDIALGDGAVQAEHLRGLLMVERLIEQQYL